MRRLRRILFNVIAALSLVLAVFIAMLWVRSFPGAESFALSRVTGRAPEQTRWDVRLASSVGFLHLGAGLYTQSGVPTAYEIHTGWRVEHSEQSVAWIFDMPGDLDLKLLTLQPIIRKPGVTYGGWATMSHFVGVKVPHSLALIVCLPLPALRAWRWRTNRWKRLAETTACARCGYDLRATPERCPECGTKPARKVTESTMVRLGGDALNALTMLSLIVAMLITLLWARSYYTADAYVIRSGSGAISAYSWYGGLIFTHYNAIEVQLGYWQTRRNPPQLFRLRCFAWTQLTGSLRGGRVLCVPTWAPLLIFVALPATRAVVWLRAHRREPTIDCPTCGYDRPATSDHCPQCGNRAATMSASPAT